MVPLLSNPPNLILAFSLGELLIMGCTIEAFTWTVCFIFMKKGLMFLFGETLDIKWLYMLPSKPLPLDSHGWIPSGIAEVCNAHCKKFECHGQNLGFMEKKCHKQSSGCRNEQQSSCKIEAGIAQWCIMIMGFMWKRTTTSSNEMCSLFLLSASMVLWQCLLWRC